ncbi:GNAT family N-acetyltransferase [Actinocorallia longicatena]|uniref:N-acetyltransferase domain-containing protein n=1 Tax=Actinocorallia longicatena TaxID=111803 RepID=A0ABP6QME7_9ACTN
MTLDRPYRPEDAAAVAGLLNTVARAGGAGLELPAEAIGNVVRAEIADPGADTRLITDAGGRLLAVALVRLPPAGGFRARLTGGVRPGLRGAGLGRELLTWQLGRAAARHAEIAPNLPWTAEVDAGADDASARRLYERLGFTVERFFFEMTAPTASPAVPRPVEDLRVVPYAPDRERAVHAAHLAAFHDSWGHQPRSFEAWAAMTVRAGTFLPGLARLALAGDEVVGHLLPYSDAPRTVYLGELGTVPAWRRRGVGRALLAAFLPAAGRSGYAEAALETDAAGPAGASSLYANAGFAIGHRIAVYRRPV